MWPTRFSMEPMPACLRRIGDREIPGRDSRHDAPIATATEPLLRDRKAARDDESRPTPGVSPITDAAARAAGRLAEELDAKLVVVGSSTVGLRSACPRTGGSSRQLSQRQPSSLRRMCLYWGVIPLPDAPAHDDRALIEFIVETRLSSGDLHKGTAFWCCPEPVCRPADTQRGHGPRGLSRSFLGRSS